MCAPGCIEHVVGRLSRRALIAAGAAGTACAPFSAAAAATGGSASKAAGRRKEQGFPAFQRVVDLTHALSPSFPTFENRPGINLKRLKNIASDGYNMMEWTLLEHCGTHIDAPIHFSATGPGPAEIAPDRLVVPLVVVDVADKAVADPDYRLTPADILAWEKRHGRLPARCCVAMAAGWDRHVAHPRYVGRDDRGVMHFPGFHAETSRMLIEQRDVSGIAVDTLSLDHGPSRDFATHTSWLPSMRWGLENVAGLGGLPPRGATLVVGAPKITGATGGPTRVLALI